jgi:hypothetical protein
MAGENDRVAAEAFVPFELKAKRKNMALSRSYIMLPMHFEC